MADDTPIEIIDNIYLKGFEFSGCFGEYFLDKPIKELNENRLHFFKAVSEKFYGYNNKYEFVNSQPEKIKLFLNETKKLPPYYRFIFSYVFSLESSRYQKFFAKEALSSCINFSKVNDIFAQFMYKSHCISKVIKICIKFDKRFKLFNSREFNEISLFCLTQHQIEFFLAIAESNFKLNYYIDEAFKYIKEIIEEFRPNTIYQSIKDVVESCVKMINKAYKNKLDTRDDFLWKLADLIGEKIKAIYKKESNLVDCKNIKSICLLRIKIVKDTKESNKKEMLNNAYLEADTIYCNEYKKFSISSINKKKLSNVIFQRNNVNNNIQTFIEQAYAPIDIKDICSKKLPVTSTLNHHKGDTNTEHNPMNDDEKSRSLYHQIFLNNIFVFNNPLVIEKRHLHQALTQKNNNIFLPENKKNLIINALTLPYRESFITAAFSLCPLFEAVLRDLANQLEKFSKNKMINNNTGECEYKGLNTLLKENKCPELKKCLTDIDPNIHLELNYLLTGKLGLKNITSHGTFTDENEKTIWVPSFRLWSLWLWLINKKH